MFKRRSGLGGLWISVGPMRRDDPATGGAGGADPTAGGGGAAPAATPPVVPAATGSTPPVAVDVTTTPEFKAALAKAAADADAKARLGTAEKARTSVLDEIATALGLKPKDVDPAAVGRELADARVENARLTQLITVGAAARKAGGDEDMVTAWLAHKGLLKTLDPAAADYASKVETIVTEQIKANPKLAGGTTAPPPLAPGAQGAAGRGMAGGAGAGSAMPSMREAIEKQMSGGR